MENKLHTMRAVGHRVLITALAESWVTETMGSPVIIAGVKVTSMPYRVLTKLDGDVVTDLGDLQRHGAGEAERLVITQIVEKYASADVDGIQKLVALSDEAW